MSRRDPNIPDPAAKAKLSMAMVTPFRFRLVADLIRGKSLEFANRQLLLNGKKKPARMMLKLLRSAAANAQQKGVADLDRLYISQLMVNEGPRIKRYLPRAQGRADQRLTRTSHVVLELAEKTLKAKAAPKKKAGTAATAAKSTAKKAKKSSTVKKTKKEQEKA